MDDFDIGETVLVRGIIKEIIIDKSGKKYKIEFEKGEYCFKTIIIPIECIKINN